MLQKTKREGKTHHLILFSYGRGATSTMTYSLTSSTPLKYCNGKENFAVKVPTAKDIQHCTDILKGGVLEHVKPEFLLSPAILSEDGGGFQARVGIRKPADDARNANDFFRWSWDAGFRHMISSYRHNSLARLVSGYELQYGHHNETMQSLPVNVENFVARDSGSVTHFNMGYQAALDNGFIPYFYSFKQVTQNFCKTLTWAAGIADFGPDEIHCHEKNKQMSTSHRKRSLEERIGKDAAASITKQLVGTPYEWMLDLSAVEWPRSVTRPLEATPLPERPHYKKFAFMDATPDAGSGLSSARYDCSSTIEKAPITIMKYLCEFESAHDTTTRPTTAKATAADLFSSNITVTQHHALMMSPIASVSMRGYVDHMQPRRVPYDQLGELSSQVLGIRLLNTTWADQKNLVNRAGHKWCGIVRDNWACMGDGYENTLRNTALYDDSLGLDAFPENTVIFAEGNSYLAEIVYTLVCHTEGADLWNSGQVGNDIFVHVPSRNVSLLLIDNDDMYNRDSAAMVNFLSHGFAPDLILLGNLNGAGSKFTTAIRKSYYAASFPSASIVEMPIHFKSSVPQ